MPGSGLGLAIVKQVADQHGGTVSAERSSDGGTTMRLRIPTADAPQGTRALVGRDLASS
jgi:two-component system sensor histidine kinase MprB